MIKILLASTLSLTLFANTQRNDIPARLQWFENGGYCGEMSLISAGLYYGQYISQYDVRAISSKDGSQTHDELLIGVNDIKAVEKLHLTYEEWNTDGEENTDQFLIWLKQKVVAGNPVAFGVYANQYLFYGNTDPLAGDSDYDHIVTAMYMSSNRPLTDPSYYESDSLGFNDNGYWQHRTTPVYFFEYGFDEIQDDRKGANDPDGSIYSLSNDASNYGIAITGIVDKDGDTLPVRIETNYPYENPPIAEGSNVRPSPMLLTLTVTVSNLTPNKTYVLYRYNQLESVPDSKFNANAMAAHEKWIFTPDGPTYVHTQEISSDEIAIYRCVKATAP